MITDIPIDILEYQNFRVFLKECYAHQKQKIKKYSYRQFSKDLGFSDSNHIYLIIIGRRNFSLSAIQKVNAHFKWTAQQKKYFLNLVLCNQTKDEQSRVKYEEELQKIKGKRRFLLTPDTYAYCSKWYIPVLKEMVSLKGFVSNLNWVAKKIWPQIDEAQIKEGFAVLERLKMVRFIKNTWVQNHEHMATPSEVSSDMVHNYQKEMIGLSSRALDLPFHKRQITSMTMSLSKEQFEWLKEHIPGVLNDIQQEIQKNQEAATVVAQLNIQLFPVVES